MLIYLPVRPTDLRRAERRQTYFAHEELTGVESGFGVNVYVGGVRRDLPIIILPIVLEPDVFVGDEDEVASVRMVNFPFTFSHFVK